MAENKKPKKILKPKETLRERASRTEKNQKPKNRRIRSAAKSASRPITAASSGLKRQVNLPLPDNKLGRLLNKRVRLIPKFFRNSWDEVKQVTWPSRPETIKLSFAVFVFAIGIGLVVTGTDYVLDKVFKEILL